MAGGRTLATRLPDYNLADRSLFKNFVKQAQHFTILTQYYPPEVGAAQVRLAAFSQALQRHGYQVQVVTAMPNYPSGVIQPAYRHRWWVREQQGNISIVRTWLYPASSGPIFKRLANYFSFAATCLVALAIVPRADILFVESPPLFLCISAWVMATLRRQKLCINISDLWPDSVVALGVMREGNFVKAARRLEVWLYQRAWRVCGVTEGIIQGITEKGVPASKLLLLPNGVDTEQFKASPYQHKQGEPHQFIYAGTHGFAHGLNVVIEAADLLRHRADIQLMLVGDGADKARLRASAKEKQLANLVFRDPIPNAEVPALLNQGYAALVTVAEGDFFKGTRSAKIFPAMAAGRAIIHSGYGEGADIVKAAQGGVVTPPADAQSLANAIAYFVDHPEEVHKMGQCGRAFVERHYSWSALVQRWLWQLEGGDHDVKHQ